MIVSVPILLQAMKARGSSTNIATTGSGLQTETKDGAAKQPSNMFANIALAPESKGGHRFGTARKNGSVCHWTFLATASELQLVLRGKVQIKLHCVLS